MKSLILFIFINLIFVTNINPQQDPIQQAEILIRNSTSHQVFVKVFPVGAVFSGHFSSAFQDTSYVRKYSLFKSNPNSDPPPYWLNEDIITGGQKFILHNDYAVIDFDDGLYYNVQFGNDKVIGGVSYGLWRFEFYYSPEGPPHTDLIADCYIDYRDFNHGSTLDEPVDIYFDLIRRPNLDADSLLFHFASGDTVNIFDNRIINKTIKSWHKVGVTNSLGQDPIIPGSPNKGIFRTRPTQFGNYPIDATQYGAVAHLQTSDIEMNLQIDSNGAKINSGDSLNFKNASLTINSGKTFTLENNSHLTFDGANSFLDAKSNNTIVLGDNATIEFKNGANIKATGVSFSGTNSSSFWKGIIISNIGTQSKIENCTFNNAQTAVSIYNSNENNASNNIFIRKNIFNVSSDEAKGVEVKNVFKLQLDSNTFNFSNSNKTIGVYLRNSINAGPPPEESEPPVYYNLNLINNRFNNDCLVPMIISCPASERTPVYVYNNSFFGNNLSSLAAYKIKGDIKNNKFDANNSYRAIGLWNSNPNLFGNNFNSVSANMYLNYSFPNMNPQTNSTSQFLWKAGKNTFYSSQKENINFVTSYPYINRGRNSFSVNDSLHIFGNVQDSVSLYRVSDNCWLGHNDLPKIYLYKYSGDSLIPVSYLSTSVFCEPDLSIAGVTLSDKGFGIYDTTYITSNSSNEPLTDDEALLNQARFSYEEKEFPEAVISYKGLIDNFASSEYIFTSAYELYDCYLALDTSDDNNVTDALYGDLRQYLQNKISSSIYDNEFNDLSYDLILMCETKMKNYTAALTGYEFLALYHPDAEQRMLASWDYDDINSLLGGGSGSGKKEELSIINENSQINNIEYEAAEFRRIDEIIENDPVMKSLEERYSKIKSRDEKTLTRDIKNYNDKKLTKDRLSSRAKENIMRVKYMTNEEKEIRRLEDIQILLKNNIDEIKIQNDNYSPDEFRLEQNYPNPFNPTTKINYSLSENSFVTMKVFDILGKEVMTLVNRKLNAGSYSVEFNGSNLSSGVYYYQLETGNNFEIKKMILIK